MTISACGGREGAGRDGVERNSLVIETARELESHPDTIKGGGAKSAEWAFSLEITMILDGSSLAGVMTFFPKMHGHSLLLLL